MKLTATAVHTVFTIHRSAEVTNPTELTVQFCKQHYRKKELTIMAFYTLTVIFHELKSICMKCDVNHATY